MKYVADFLKYFYTPKFPVFTKTDAYLFLRQSDVTDAYAKKFLSNLVKSGRIYRIKRNHYTCYDDPYAAGFAFAPFYYGLGTALNMHNLTEQQSQPVVISATSVMPRTIIFNSKKIFIKRIRASMFFGVATLAYGAFEIPVSDIEKTFIDLIYFRYGVDEQVYENLTTKLDKIKLERYLKTCAPHIRKSADAIMQRFQPGRGRAKK